MQSLRLKNDSLSRVLHDQLYKRIVAFCEQYTPEIPGDVVAKTWLSRLFDDDDALHIHVNLDDNYKVVGHTVIDVQNLYGFKVVYCHQAQADKGYPSTLDQGAEYVDKVAAENNAAASVFTVTKHIKSLEKKYGYKSVRSIMVKDNTDVEAGSL